MFRVSKVLAACVLTLSASVSMAASQSSASISSLTFTLIDLNPNDGIAPSFDFLTTTGSTALSVSATDNALGESENASRTRAGTFVFTNEYLAQLSNANAQASIGTQSLSVSGAAAGPQTSYNAAASTGANPSSYYYNQPLNLSLSANSLLLISANIDLSASASNPQACSYYYYCNTSENSSASASMSLSYNYSMPGGSASYNTVQSKSLQATARGESSYYYGYVYNPLTGYYESQYITTPKLEENKSLSDVLSGVFTNSSNASQLASLGLSVSVNGLATTLPELDTLSMMALGTLAVAGVARAKVSAVPESSTHAMNLLGLSMLGLAWRRRQK